MYGLTRILLGKTAVKPTRLLRKSLGQYESAISAANRDVYIGLGFGAALLLSPVDELTVGGYVLLKVGGM